MAKTSLHTAAAFGPTNPIWGLAKNTLATAYVAGVVP